MKNLGGGGEVELSVGYYSQQPCTGLDNFMFWRPICVGSWQPYGIAVGF